MMHDSVAVRPLNVWVLGPGSAGTPVVRRHISRVPEQHLGCELGGLSSEYVAGVAFVFCACQRQTLLISDPSQDPGEKSGNGSGERGKR